MITFRRTGKLSGGDGLDEVLGYNSIEVYSVCWNKEANAFVAECMVSGASFMGMKSKALHVSEIMQDVENGYLKAT